MTCPGDIELSRAVSASAPDPELAAHLAACATCRAAWDGTRAAIDLARELPVALPPASRREEVRTAVLAAAAGGPAQRPARRAWLGPAIAGAAAAGIAGYLAISRAASPPPPPHHAHGSVRPHPGARYLVSSIGPDEVIQLSDGAIDVDVEPLHPGERFRVLVGGDEIEVRGTAFTAIARGGHLTDVAVAHGRVDLTPDRGARSTIATGQVWHTAIASAPVDRVPAPPPPRPARGVALPAADAPPRDAPTAVSSLPRVTVAPRDASTAAPSRPRVVAAPRRDEPAPVPPAGRSPEEVSYDDAWAALRTGDFPRAATGFTRVMLLAPDGPLAEDASFWRPVALARGQRSAEAVSAFRDFLDGHARSSRAGEASAMLGWLLIDARAYDEAARRFDAAIGDASPAVRQSAKAGLDALATRKR